MYLLLGAYCNQPSIQPTSIAAHAIYFVNIEEFKESPLSVSRQHWTLCNYKIYIDLTMWELNKRLSINATIRNMSLIPPSSVGQHIKDGGNM